MHKTDPKKGVFPAAFQNNHVVRAIESRKNGDLGLCAEQPGDDLCAVAPLAAPGLRLAPGRRWKSPDPGAGEPGLGVPWASGRQGTRSQPALAVGEDS